MTYYSVGTGPCSSFSYTLGVGYWQGCIQCGEMLFEIIIYCQNGQFYLMTSCFTPGTCPTCSTSTSIPINPTCTPFGVVYDTYACCGSNNTVTITITEG